MYFGDLQSANDNLSKLLSTGALGNANQGSQAYLNKMGQAPTIPGLDAATLQAILANTNQQINTGSNAIQKQMMQGLGDVTALMGTRGLLGSSGMARAAGQVGSTADTNLANLISQLMSTQSSDILNLRNSLLGAQTQQYGYQGNMLNSLMGNQMQGMQIGSNNAQAQSQIDQQNQSAILGLLGQLGGGIAGIGGSFLMNHLLGNNKQQVDLSGYFKQ
jgi:hypothetical protein